MTAAITLQWWQLALVVGGVAMIAALSTAVLLRRSAAPGAGTAADARPAAPAPAPAAPAPAAPAPPPAARAPAPAAPAAPAAAPAAPAPGAAPALTAGLIAAFDLADGAPAVRSHIVQTLRSAGVVQLPAAEGAPFDPAEHLAVGTDLADQQRAGRVARTVRPGWVQDGAVLRPAEVVVWTA
jgi:hypothetical protein